MTLLRKDENCTPCGLVSWVVMVLLFVGVAVSLIGVYHTHFLGGMNFTSPQGAMYVVAFALTLTLWAKHMRKCCGCGSGCCK